MINYKEIQQLISNGKFTEAISICLMHINDSANQEADTPLSLQEVSELRYLLAVSYRLSKQNTAAIEVLSELLLSQPEHSRAHQELGYNHQILANEKLASEHFYKATKQNPSLLSSWKALLPIYKAQAQQQAYGLCLAQIKKLEALPKAVLAASDLFYDNKIDAAEKLCLQYLQQNRHSLPALLLLAEIASKLRAISEAEFILETCVELAPNEAEPKYALFKVYSRLGKYEAALDLSHALLDIDSSNIFYLAAKADSLVGLGYLKEAITIYQDLLEQQSDRANIHLLLGHAQKAQGDLEASIKSYQTAYEFNAHLGDAYWSLANAKTYRFSEDEISQMLSIVQMNDIATADLVHLHFALGKAFEDQKSYDSSFKHYALGNQLKRSTLRYSSDNHIKFIDSMIATFTSKMLAEMGSTGCDDPSPIFIVGLPRAGSTLLEQILASHSLVDGTMELHEILGLAANLSKKRQNSETYPSNVQRIPPDTLKKLGEKFIQDTSVYRQQAPYFIDKMPNNFMHIGLIKSILPNAKIIDARRNPMACCFSGFKQLFGEGQEFSYSLADIAQYYQSYLKLMAHWNTLYPNQILTVQHEDVVNDTEAQVRRILDYCGLDFEEACLSFYKNKRAVKTPSSEQVRQPIYTSGLQQWKNYEAHLDILKRHFES